MNAITKLSHKFGRGKCIKKSKWDKGVLRCCECGEIIALRYFFDGEVHVYVYPEYSKYRHEISEMPDTQGNSPDGNSLGNVSFQEFDDFLYYLKLEQDSILSVQEDDEGIREDIEVDFPNRIGEEN